MSCWVETLDLMGAILIPDPAADAWGNPFPPMEVIPWAWLFSKVKHHPALVLEQKFRLFISSTAPPRWAHGMFLVGGPCLLSGHTVLWTSANTKLINSWIKIALQHWHLCLVKCLQGAIIALGLQGKIIKNKNGGENTLSFLLWKLLIPWSPQLPLSSELLPVCFHWFWTYDQMWK